MNIDLRPATSNDEEFLYRVYGSTRGEELAMTGWSDEQKEQFLRMQFRAQMADYARRFSYGDHDIILADGEPAGRMWVTRDPEEIRLVDIAILLRFRGRGVGSELIGRLLEEGDRERTPVRHMVFQANERAIRLYERLGFKVAETVSGYHLMERLPSAGSASGPDASDAS